MTSDSTPVMAPVPMLEPKGRAALVIATARYDDPDLAQLRAPVRDAQDLAAVLADPQVGGFTVTTVTDQTEAHLRRQVAAFLATVTAEQTVLVYLSCHGIQDRSGRLYFAATDTIKAMPRATALSSVLLLEDLDECHARQQILILDCCFSGAFDERQKGMVDLERHLAGHGRGRIVLTASRGFEYSYEGQPVNGAPPGSVFTTGLVHGLRSGAADTDGDGYVTWDEAFAYADQHVRNADAPQTPQAWLFEAEGAKIILARSPKGRSVIPAPLPAHLADGLASGSVHIRIGAVNELAEWLASPDPTRGLAASLALQNVADHDNPQVAAAARRYLAQRSAPGTPMALATRPPPPQSPSMITLIRQRLIDAGENPTFRVAKEGDRPDEMLSTAARRHGLDPEDIIAVWQWKQSLWKRSLGNPDSLIFTTTEIRVARGSARLRLPYHLFSEYNFTTSTYFSASPVGATRDMSITRYYLTISGPGTDWSGPMCGHGEVDFVTSHLNYIKQLSTG